MNRYNPLSEMLMLAARNPGLAAQGLQIPIAGSNNMPNFGAMVPGQGAQLNPQLPIPNPVMPSKTRGETATAIRDDIGSLLMGGL